MLANKDSFDNDKEEILFILSYMKNSLAGQWAENEYNPILEEVDITITFKDFEGRLKATFSNPKKERNAQHQLSTTCKGFNKRAKEFFQKLHLN